MNSTVQMDVLTIEASWAQAACGDPSPPVSWLRRGQSLPQRPIRPLKDLESPGIESRPVGAAQLMFHNIVYDTFT